MITFDDIVYQRPNFPEKSAALEAATQAFEDAGSAAEQSACLAEIYRIRSEVEAADMLNQIRLAQRSTDEFLQAERTVLNQAFAEFQSIAKGLPAALLRTPFRDELGAQWGPQLFVIPELASRVTSPEISQDLAQERALVQSYETLVAQSECSLEGKVYSLAALSAILRDPDQALRKKAYEARSELLMSLRNRVSGIFQELVTLRGQMARRLGFSTFTEMAYSRMQRSSYGPDDVAKLRAQIADLFTPLAARLENARRARLNLEDVTAADDAILFPDGNARPLLQGQDLVDAIANIFDRFAPETRDFFRVLMDAQMLDLEDRPGKALGGFCEALHDRGLPFLFANFNGTSSDVDVLVHEGGHAFQYFLSREIPAIDLRWPSMDAAETSAMTFELFLLDQMADIFGPDTEKYVFAKLHTAVSMMPYRCAIDEFQEIAYNSEAPDFDQIWNDVDLHYRPYRDRTGDPVLETGCEWMLQRHLFGAPFYFIDYNLAEISALRLWQRYQNEPRQTWADFVNFCSKGGTLDYAALIGELNLASVFAPGSVAEACDIATSWFETSGHK